LNGEEPVGWAWNVLLAFVCIGTNPRVFATPLTVDEAFHYVDQWLLLPPSRIVERYIMPHFAAQDCDAGVAT
jgi:hypothetical protein